MAHAVTAPPRAGVIALARRIALRFGRTARSPATDHKGSATGRLIALETGAGQPVWSPRDYSAFARDGMMQNAVVYRSVRMIAEAAAAVPLLVYEDGREVEGHPLAELLARPNPAATGTDLLESFYGFLLVAGNAYLEAVAFGGELRELHALRPDRMKVIPGADGWPAAWEYSAGGETVRIAGEAAPGVPRILHLKLFHPANDHYGLSPIEAAATAIDIHNAASRWNKALLDNSARPSGALVYGGGQHLPPEQFDRLKEELSGAFQGVRNAGRPMLLEGGLDWKAMSLSPRDMDFIEAKHAAAREIALALGVPPMLLGIPGDNTYSNLVEANRAFWRQTVLPLVTRAAKGIAHWLAPAWDGSVCLLPDLDQVEALAPEREALWARLEKASFLTDDEKRAAVGYGAKGDDDELVGKAGFRPGQLRVPAGSPGGGQWTDGTGGSVANDIGGDGQVFPIQFSPDSFGWHDYTEGPFLVCPAEVRCTIDEMADQMARFAVPGQDPTQPVVDGNWYTVRDPWQGIPVGRVTTTIAPDGLTIINRTQWLHIFYDGQIERTARQVEDGSWFVRTRGIGNNWIPGMNWVNRTTGPEVFRALDQRMRDNIEQTYGNRSKR